LGVPLAQLEALGAFGKVDWRVLAKPLPDGCLPALAGDRTTLRYGLAAKAGIRDGTVLVYPSGHGDPVRLRIVATLPQRVSVLQGRLLVNERHFAAAFPDRSGYRQWLVKPAAGGRHPAELLSQGWEIEGCAERLRTLGAMENSYLDMFLVLGGLGVLLGVTGLAILLLRNVEARSSELTLLRALGVSRARLATYLLAEQMGLLVLGLLLGAVPALLLLLPVMARLSQEVPVGAIVCLLLGYLGIGAGTTLAAAIQVLRRPVSLARLNI
jgi:putative ABC transport system permease protein